MELPMMMFCLYFMGLISTLYGELIINNYNIYDPIVTHYLLKAHPYLDQNQIFIGK